MKKILFAFALLGSAMLNAQEGVLKISVTDSTSGEVLEFASVKIENAGTLIRSGMTDVQGNLTVKNLSPGNYDVKTIYTGKRGKEIKKVLIKNNETTYLEIGLASSDKVIDVFTVTDFKNPFIDGHISVKPVFMHDDIIHSALQNPDDILSTVPGAVQMRDGGASHFRGGRDGSVVYIIDGIPSTSTHGVPINSIQQMSVTLGGIPAQYGDATGAVIEIETRSGLVR